MIKVFYSYDFNNDATRVQPITELNVVRSDKPISREEWKKIKIGGTGTIKKWIRDNLLFCSCLVVLVGEETANKPLIKYEIKRAWTDNIAVLGIYIHNLKCLQKGKSNKGPNPFEQFSQDGIDFSSIVKCYDPDINDPYNDINNNIEKWIKEAIDIRVKYMFSNEYVE